MSDDTSDEELTRLLAFAQHVGSPDTAPRDTALARGWITEDDEVTKDGRDCLDSLGDQSDTRTVFRGEF